MFMLIQTIVALILYIEVGAFADLEDKFIAAADSEHPLIPRMLASRPLIPDFIGPVANFNHQASFDNSNSSRRHARTLKIAEKTARMQLSQLLVHSHQYTDKLKDLELVYTSKMGDFLIALSGEFSNTAHIINIENPSAPSIIAEFVLSEGIIQRVLSLAVNPQETLLAVGFAQEISLFSISREGTFRRESTLFNKVPLQSYMFQFEPSKDVLYFLQAQGIGVQRINVENVQNPIQLAPLQTRCASAREDTQLRKFKVLSDGTLVQTLVYDGLCIFNINGGSAAEIATLKTGFRNRFIEVDAAEETLYLTDTLEGLVIVDVSERSNPKILSTVVLQRLFTEVELQQPRLSDDQRLLYCNTYENRLFVLDIRNKAKPAIVSILEASPDFSILKDVALGISLTKGLLEIFDIQELILKQSELAPTLIQEHTPVLFQKVNLAGISGDNPEISFTEYFDEHDLLVYVDTPIRGTPMIHFFDTSRSLLDPTEIGKFQPNISDDQAQMQMVFSRDTSRLYIAMRFLFNETYSLTALDTSDWADIRVAGFTTFSSGYKESSSPHLTNLVLLREDASLIFGITHGQIFRFTVTQDNLRLTSMEVNKDGEGGIKRIAAESRGLSQVLYVLQDFGLTIYDATSPLLLLNRSRVELEATGDSIQVGNRELIIPGGSQGVYSIDTSNLYQPELSFLYGPASVDFNHVVGQGDLVMAIGEEKIGVYNYSSGTARQLSVSDGRLLQASRIKDTGMFFGLVQVFYGDRQLMLVEAEIQNIFAVKVEDKLELGDVEHVIHLHPMRMHQEDGFEFYYSDVWEEHKLVNLRQFASFANGFETNLFPKWATPDPANSRMLLELNTPDALGAHYIYSLLSFRIPDDAFKNLPTIGSVVGSLDLKHSLMDKGYLDNEAFLTDFDISEPIQIDREFSQDEGLLDHLRVEEATSKDLLQSLWKLGILTKENGTHSILNPSYSNYALYSTVIFLRFNQSDYDALQAIFKEVSDRMVEPKVRAILKSYLLEVVGEFIVHSSLALTMENGISISTKSQEVVRLSLEIEDPNCAQFMDDSHGAISKDKSHLLIEGLASEVNEALASVRIHQQLTNEQCSYKVLVNDQLNPPLEDSGEAIAEHFALNQGPKFSMALQDQFDLFFSGKSIAYKEYFEFEPMIINEAHETLQYKVLIAQEGQQEPLRWTTTEFQDWLMIDHDTGILSGSPRDHTVWKTFRVKYIVSDEFASVEDEFEIQVKPTPGFIFNLVWRYVSGVVFLIGCWRFKEKLHQVFAQRKYKYPKNIRALVGKPFFLEIPIAPLELEDENNVMSFMKECAIRKAKRSNRRRKGHQWIEEYFNDDGVFDPQEFISDLKMVEFKKLTEQTVNEAMRQFALLICFSIFKGQISQVEDQILSLFAQDITNEPLWNTLKEIMFHMVQSINNNTLHIPIRTHGVQVDRIQGFRPNSGGCKESLLRCLNLHGEPLPEPTCLPSWLKCEMDPNFIILQGMPPFESKDETTLVRIFDTSGYLIRQFNLEVEERIDPSNSTIVHNSSIDPMNQDRGSFVSQHSFSRMYTMTNRTVSNRARSLQKSRYSRKRTHQVELHERLSDDESEHGSRMTSKPNTRSQMLTVKQKTQTFPPSSMLTGRERTGTMDAIIKGDSAIFDEADICENTSCQNKDI